ncbi:alpha/beta hydrolase family protein [Billgrantia antri]|uniref:Alpha/beta hydrolase n=1 Tax=Billgrantia antri TaxID=2846777 RepID=A0ABS6ZJK2_9GAMM|nr:alpha/beta fold hydrolase [Halomonas antri]MBW6390253.1 alpha/beta hydrolase [Halomonas antri]
MKALCCVVVLCAYSLSALAEPIAGYDRLDIAASHRSHLVEGSLWYPAGTTTYRSVIGSGPIFQGESAYVGAAIAEGRHPLILLSHGSGGNMDSLAWLSSALARQGIMVLAVNHPGSTTGDSSPRRSIRLWERAHDLSAALDQLLDDPLFAPYVDTSRITALGFSLGGATALNLAGLRVDWSAFGNYCERGRGDEVDCQFFAKGGIVPGTLPDGIEQDALDPRVMQAIAVDPGFAYAYTDTSIAALQHPTLLISLGAAASRWSAVELGPQGSALATRLPNATHVEIAPANHFTFLAECTEEGEAWLAEEGDDPICSDPEGADRRQVHQEAIATITRFLGP